MGEIKSPSKSAEERVRKKDPTLTEGQMTARDSGHTTPHGMTKPNRVFAKMFLQCSWGFSTYSFTWEGNLLSPEHLNWKVFHWIQKSNFCIPNKLKYPGIWLNICVLGGRLHVLLNCIFILNWPVTLKFINLILTKTWYLTFL